MQLKPSWQSLANRILWLTFFPAIWLALILFGQPPAEHLILDGLIVFLVVLAIKQAINQFFRRLGLYPDYLTITDIWGNVENYKWQEIHTVHLEVCNYWLPFKINPSWTPYFLAEKSTLTFFDRNDRLHEYVLSDLSPPDREKAEDFIMAKVPEATDSRYPPPEDIE